MEIIKYLFSSHKNNWINNLLKQISKQDVVIRKLEITLEIVCSVQPFNLYKLYYLSIYI